MSKRSAVIFRKKHDQKLGTLGALRSNREVRGVLWDSKSLIFSRSPLFDRFHLGNLRPMVFSNPEDRPRAGIVHVCPPNVHT
jgi:hypothetical protein